MFRDKTNPLRKIHLADQQFANQIVGKYGWRIDNGFARSKLQHRIEPKKRDSITFAKSPIIQLTKVIQPLHIKLIYEYHQLNQIIEYKNAPLLVSSPLSNVALGKTVDAVPNTTTQYVMPLLEKVKQTAQMKAERQLLQQVQSQIERKTILTTSHHMQSHEGMVAANSQQPSGKHTQETVKLVRTSLIAANQASHHKSLATINQDSNRMSAIALSSELNASSANLSIKQTANGLHHIEHIEMTQRVSKKQVAVARMILSPYIRNIVKEEQERITAEFVERNSRYRTKAILHKPELHETQAVKKRELLRETQEVTLTEVHSIARKAMINKSLSTVLEQWHRKLTIGQITMLRQQKQQQDVHHIRSKSQHVQKNNALTETNREQRHSNTNHQSNPERQTMVKNMKYYLKTNSHHVQMIKHHQKTLQGVHKLVYIPLSSRDNTAVNEKATLIYRNSLTQVDSRVTNNQHLHKHEESSNVASLSPRLIARITGEVTKKQQRRIETTTVQIRKVTSFHRQLIERNERLIYQIEMVEKKKTPRARKLSLVPVVKLSYRVLPEERPKGFVRLPQDQHVVDNGRQAELPSPLISKQPGIRRQAELIHTVTQKHQSSKDQVLPTIARAITMTIEERMKRRVSSTNISNELITQQSQYVTGQITHISKVNKTQLRQVKMLQSKLKQLQAVTMVMTQTSRTGVTNYSKSQSEQSSNHRNDTLKTTIEHSTDFVKATNNSQTNQLYYRLINNNSPQQLGALIHELQQSRSQAISSAVNNVATLDTVKIDKPMSMTARTINSIVTKRINLIHSSQQQSERLTKRLKQLGEVTTLRKVKDMISTQSPLSIVQTKTSNEENLQLIVNEQHSKSRLQMVEQVRRNTQSSMNLHIAKQQSKQQDDTKQQDAVKQLEVTVKRLEQELTTTKETRTQPSINIRQLSEQLFDQITKKIRLEQHRNGR